ncbi:MAG TPA: GH3 auxin-responsive promoter family protein [Puia sp.]|jgi:hypothetical protein|nr:GH3 auxin-responsive promoter family protein [Puia sp.]
MKSEVGSLNSDSGLRTSYFWHSPIYQIGNIRSTFFPVGLPGLLRSFYMKIKSFLAKPFASYIYKNVVKDISTAVNDQENILKSLLKVGAKTVFGQEHKLQEVKTYEEYKSAVPLRDYEQFKIYIDHVKEGKHNILWKGRPIYFAKTSGTTSGTKYIPITKDSITNHISTARNALLCYMAETGNTQFANGKMIFLSGSPELERIKDIPTGRLSGIVNHHVPRYLRTNQLPSYETNCIEDWETKLDKIVEETIKQDMTLISGIPPWMQMYFDRLTEVSGKKIKDLFPNFSVLVHGGVNFEPYKHRLFEAIGKKIDSIETFPASEGFFAFQDSQKEEGLLLNTNSGIFFEFIPVNEIYKENPQRISLKDVQEGENYVLAVSSNAGLWGYNIGDTVKFVSTNPYRLVVTGRTKHFISAFGEHVIGEEVEYSLIKAAEEEGVNVTEFTVAPMIQQEQGKSYHEWFVEFENTPGNMRSFAKKVDENLRQKNIYYNDLITGNILKPLEIRVIKKNGFIEYMKSVGKLGGQNKVPRLSNDRKLAEDLVKFTIDN